MTEQSNHCEFPLLSVVVPCYNIEKELLDKCLASIVQQTYTNLEIILVNDGSTDQTGAYCDEWQTKDQRIRVVHKQNEGVCWAYKTGVESTNGEYITFVDQDDWIDRNMYTHMMSVLLSTGVDIVQCDYRVVYDDSVIDTLELELQNIPVEIINRTEGVLLMLENKKWQNYIWNKIFKKRVFDHVTFPKGLLIDDIAYVHVLFHHASQSAYLHATYYYYYQRAGSIVNPKTESSDRKKQYHHAWALYERYLFVKQYPQYHEMLQPIKEKMLNVGVAALRCIFDFPQDFPNDEYQKHVQRLKSIPFSCRDNLPFLYKFDLLVWKIHPRCYRMYRLLYKGFKSLLRK